MVKARTTSSQIFIEEMNPTKNNKTKMTLDEAIKHCEEKAEEKRKDYERAVALNIPSDGCFECAREHEQLAEWLKELKDYRENLRTCENCKYEARCGDELPCSVCRCNHPNKFEWKGGAEE